MKEIKDVLNMSNTAIKKLKKGELETAVIKLKAMYSNSVSNGNTDAMGIEITETASLNLKLTEINESQITRIRNLEGEIEIIRRKGSTKASAIQGLKEYIDQLETQIRELKQPWYSKIFN